MNISRRDLLSLLVASAAVVAVAIFTAEGIIGAEEREAEDQSWGSVMVEIGDLKPDSVVPPVKDGKPLADVHVETKEDEGGKYALIRFIRKLDTPRWTETTVKLPQITFTVPIESVELDAWNPGVPIKIVADATDASGTFEIPFCGNDTVWKGWRKLKAQLGGKRFAVNFLGELKEITPPFRLEHLLIIMRKGQPWEIGLRNLTVRPSAIDPEDQRTNRTLGEKYPRLTLKGDGHKQDSFSLVFSAAVRMLGIEADYNAVCALSTNAFAPGFDPDESCKRWWGMYGGDQGIDLVARAFGIKVRRIVVPPLPDAGPTEEGFLQQRRQLAPKLAKALAEGEVIVTDGGWHKEGAFLPRWWWGIVTEAREDGTILGACLNGRKNNPLVWPGTFYALSAGRPVMDRHEADLAMLRLSVKRVHNLLPQRGNVVYGLPTMDLWIEQMETTPFCPDSKNASWICAASTARTTYHNSRTAAAYLKARAETFPDRARPHILAAAECYQRIVELLMPALEGKDWKNYHYFMDSAAKRHQHAEVLRECKAKMAVAVDEMEKALAAAN